MTESRPAFERTSRTVMRRLRSLLPRVTSLSFGGLAGLDTKTVIHVSPSLSGWRGFATGVAFLATAQLAKHLTKCPRSRAKFLAAYRLKNLKRYEAEYKAGSQGCHT